MQVTEELSISEPERGLSWTSKEPSLLYLSCPCREGDKIISPLFSSEMFDVISPLLSHALNQERIA